ncbi:GNAT family N-acetyltransferase [Candidatus Obscuribacterales bacterium]|nr:GNAT family N-acetyltransferase [Candidatus Obscuribacterales bacterium]
MTATKTISKLTKADAAQRCKVYELTGELVDEAKARKVAAMFEAALGKNGVAAEGHEPYPDPSLYSAAGVLETVESPYRRLFIAELDGEIVGGIIADSLHELACEFNCMAVDRAYRGLGIGSILVEGAKRVINDCFFFSNITEMVTHNLASQTAHIKHGYNRFLGFGYSHYPNVFFVDRPESVVWAGQLHGRFAKELPNLRGRIGNLDKLSDSELTETLIRESRQVVGKASESEQQLATALVKPRFVYVPDEYESLGRDILAQYAEHLDYRVNEKSENADRSDHFEVDFKPDYAHTYIDFGSGFDIHANAKTVKEKINEVKNAPGKRFIRATIKANHSSAIEIANFLRKEGFVFHSILPLYQYENQANGASHRFHDLLVLQWVCPEAAAKNPLPGETNSVIKVYGYPANLTGKIISLIRSELNSSC